MLAYGISDRYDEHVYALNDLPKGMTGEPPLDVWKVSVLDPEPYGFEITGRDIAAYEYVAKMEEYDLYELALWLIQDALERHPDERLQRAWRGLRAITIGEEDATLDEPIKLATEVRNAHQPGEPLYQIAEALIYAGVSRPQTVASDVAKALDHLVPQGEVVLDYFRVVHGYE